MPEKVLWCGLRFGWNCEIGGVGPSWKGIYGRTEILADGSTVVADDAYLRESITNPAAKLVEGYPPVMAAYPMSEDDQEALVAYFMTLTE